ncbi:hypothetical protein OUZ56_016546 [Daphnia magna]|uniref:Mon2/Sec7/BIG1-like HDS domain-containing protein n=1 Tax=Daphnia magna TaxID=35525 RepID=A0ABR0AQY5_9CRUS|nr:hypothetical protein OUZ56_016546 [Daphnia magna]
MVSTTTWSPRTYGEGLQTLLISPLNELSSTSFADVQLKQVDCVLHLLHSSGDIISFGWPLFLNIIGATNNSQGRVIKMAAIMGYQNYGYLTPMILRPSKRDYVTRAVQQMEPTINLLLPHVCKTVVKRVDDDFQQVICYRTPKNFYPVQIYKTSCQQFCYGKKRAPTIEVVQTLLQAAIKNENDNKRKKKIIAGSNATAAA